ncbi:MAG TPA: sugar ABC transporter ATP-binding protein [Bryobacteraceae bacterium]|nr:sugar ABC transporter ATP-binding protein [Bryobacteraceae bacterium]
MPNLLQADGVSKHYGGVAALRNAHFALQSGEVHALIGENGAGKSTLAKVLAGAVRADFASIAIDGQPVTIASPLDAQRLGIGIIYQELDLFPHLTVGENMAIGNLALREPWLVRFGRMEAFCRPYLEQVGLSCSLRQLAGSLPIGQLQLLAIARALSMKARILVMDEPTSALSGDAVERLFGLIRELKGRGVAMVYVSHKMDEIFRICDRATVLRDGETIRTVEMGATTASEIIRLMVGRDLRIATRPEHRPTRDVVFNADRVTTHKLNSVSFELRRGEVLGVAGLVGAGRSELGAALFGLDPIHSGTMRCGDRTIAPRSAREAMRHGIGLVPEDRRLEGLMMSMSVLENGSLAVLDRMQKWGFLRRGQEQRELAAMATQLAVNCPSLEASVDTLSGGNQQKVLLARWLLLDPGVLFLDDPTRGIDIGAKQDIYNLIDRVASAGKGVILVSSELPELLRCCDRVMVLSGGRVTAVYDATEATPEKIMAAATSVGSRPEGAA